MVTKLFRAKKSVHHLSKPNYVNIIGWTGRSCAWQHMTYMVVWQHCVLLELRKQRWPPFVA